jgi:hypothetical protein
MDHKMYDIVSGVEVMPLPETNYVVERTEIECNADGKVIVCYWVDMTDPV